VLQFAHPQPTEAIERTISVNPEEPCLKAPDRCITIAFDGACLGNPGPGGYGAVLVNERTGRTKEV